MMCYVVRKDLVKDVAGSFNPTYKIGFCDWIQFNLVTKYATPTSTDKILEKNSSFHVKQRTTGKVQLLFSRSLLLVLTKFSFREEGWTIGYTSMKF